MHSWRVLVLPYLEQHELYGQYDFNEPWNGPHNIRFKDKMPSAFRCPLAKGDSNETSYVAVVGPETAWPDGQPTEMRTIRDGTSKTILLVESADSGINWLEPRDLSFEQALQGINPPGKKPTISSHHAGGVNVICGDAHVIFLPDSLPIVQLRGLLTAAGGEHRGEASGQFAAALCCPAGKSSAANSGGIPPLDQPY